MGSPVARFAVLVDYALSNFQEEPKIGISKYLHGTGIQTVYFGLGNLAPGESTSMLQAKLLDFISPEEFDGIIIMSASLVNHGGIKFLAEKLKTLEKMPMVSIGPPVLKEASFIYDSRSGTREIMQHLVKQHGYTNFAYVSGPLDNQESVIRRDTYRKILEEAGIAWAAEAEYEGDFVSASGEQAVAEFLDKRKLRPQVIVCVNDRTAIGVWNALSARGYQIPQDIALTGFDDNRLDLTVSSQFTTYRQSFVELGYQAARHLHRLCQGDKPARPRALRGELIIRSSCGCIEYRDRKPLHVKNFKAEKTLELSAKIEEFEKSGYQQEDIRDFYKAWSAAIRKTLARKELTYEYEQLLLQHSNPGVNSNDKNRKDYFFSTLYMMLVEENNHALVLGSWNRHVYDQRLRIAVDRLQNGLTSDLTYAAHREAFLDLAAICGAESFHVLNFLDYEHPQLGASIIYSTEENREWSPGPGAWFPPDNSSYVLNMIINGDRNFGYFMIDSKLANPATYDYLRIRLSSISQDMIAIHSIRELNTRLSSEIKEREKAERNLKKALDMVGQLSIRDELTGLYNRRGFMTLAEQQLRYLRRERQGFLILFMDLDGLKIINDQYGHFEGDQALKATAEALKLALRDSDIISRFAGDEFAVLLTSDHSPDGTVIRKRILESCRQTSRDQKKPWSLSLSIGLAYSTPVSTETLQELLKIADTDLYKVKKQTR